MDIRRNSRKYYITTDVVLHLWLSKVKFFPEPVMLVDDDLSDHLIECYQTVSSDTLFISNLFDILISDKTNDLKTLKEIIEKLSC